MVHNNCFLHNVWVTRPHFPHPCSLSLFRISDLIVTVCMGFLSLIISAVLTDGLKRTCDNTEPAGMR